MRIERVESHLGDPKEFGASNHGTPNLGQVVGDFFKSADANGDGQVSKPELEETLRKVLNPPVSYTRSGGLQAEPHSGCFSATA